MEGDNIMMIAYNILQLDENENTIHESGITFDYKEALEMFNFYKRKWGKNCALNSHTYDGLIFEIDGEGSYKKLVTNNRKWFSQDYMLRQSEAKNVDLGYNKHWIKIFKGEKLIFHCRLDLNYKTFYTSVWDAIINDIEASKRYAIKNNCEDMLKSCKDALLLIQAIYNNTDIIYEYDYYVNNKVIQNVITHELFDENTITTIITNISESYNTNKQNVKVLTKTHRITY